MTGEQYLVLSAVGRDRPGLVAEVTEFLVERGCSVEESRMAVLGGEFGMIMLVRGPADRVLKLAQEAADLEQRTGLQFLFRTTVPPHQRGIRPSVPYRLSARCLDHEGVVHAVSEALSELGVNIASLETTAYSAPITGTPLFRMDALLEVPADLPPPRLRTALAGLADQQNLDIEVHPV